MQIAHSPWWIFLIIFFLCPIAEGDEEKIKRAIYNYQKGPKVPSGGKSNDEYFKNFQGISPFEQVLAALGLSGDDQSKIHTSVEYWPPDMDREKFYQMVKGESFPFTSWNYEPKPYSAPAPNPSPIKPIFEEVQDEVPQKISTPFKRPESSHKKGEVKSLSPSYYPRFIDHVVSYPPIEEHTEVIEETPKYVKEHVPQVFEEISEYPEYPTYVEETTKTPVKYFEEITKPPVKYYEKPPEAVKEVPRTPKIKEVFKSHREEAPKFHYILQSNKTPEKYPKAIEEIPKKAPRIVEVTPKIMMEAYTTTTTLKPKLYKPKFIHSSKIPAQPELPSSISPSFNHVISSTIKNASDDDDISMTDAGPVLFPEITTTKNKIQRGSVRSHPSPPSLQQENHREQHLHEVSQQQQPTRSNKKRKLKKKVKTSSIAQEVVDIGNRGSSGTLHTPLRPLDVIVVTTTIAPKTSFTASTAVNFIANDAVTADNVLVGGGDVSTHLSDGYVDPNYSDMIDNLSKLTELSFNNGYKTEISNDYVPRVYSTASTTELSPVTETLNNFELKHGNSSIVTDENMIAVLNLMKNSSTTMSDTSMEELKKAVIDNDLPKVKKIVRQHIGKRPVIDKSTTESASVTRGKVTRPRFGLKTRVTSSTTESSSTTKILSSSPTTRSKILKKPVTTVKQVISTTARSSRQSNRTRPSTTPRSTTSRSTKSIARRVTTTRKSIKTTTASA